MLTHWYWHERYHWDWYSFQGAIFYQYLFLIPTISYIYISKTCWLWSLTAPNFHWSPWIPLGPASNQWKAFSHDPLGPPKSTIYFGLLDAPLKVLKVLKPTVSRESFWNHSIKKWPDIASPFILDNNIKGFIAFWMFLVQKWLPNEHKKFRNPRPPPLFRNFS